MLIQIIKSLRKKLKGEDATVELEYDNGYYGVRPIALLEEDYNEMLKGFLYSERLLKNLMKRKTHNEYAKTIITSFTVIAYALEKDAFLRRYKRNEKAKERWPDGFQLIDKITNETEVKYPWKDLISKERPISNPIALLIRAHLENLDHLFDKDDIKISKSLACHLSPLVYLFKWHMSSIPFSEWKFLGLDRRSYLLDDLVKRLNLIWNKHRDLFTNE